MIPLEATYDNRNPFWDKPTHLIDCPECDGKGCFENISDCCGDKREPDMGLCYECHDHCEAQECLTCSGTGKIEVTYEDLQDAEGEDKYQSLKEDESNS